MPHLRTDQLKEAAIILALIIISSGAVYYLKPLETLSSASENDHDLVQLVRSMKTTLRYNGARFPKVSVRNAITKNRILLFGPGMQIILVISGSGCSHCQNRELHNLDTLYSAIPKDVEGIKVGALYYSTKPFAQARKNALIIKKVTGASYPIWITNDPRLGTYMSAGKIPMLFVLQGNRVIASFKPIPDNDAFSYWYMRRLRQIVRGNQLRPPNLPASIDGTKTKLKGGWSVTKVGTGEEQRIYEFIGNPLLINIWATWCGPCLKELESLDNLYRQIHGEGPKILLVSFENLKVVEDFANRMDLDVPLYIAQRESVPKQINPYMIPKTVIVNRNGGIIFEETGAYDWSTGEVISFLEKL